MTERDYDEELDVRYRMCPCPSIRTMDALGGLVTGQILRVKVNSKGSASTINIS